MNDYDIEKVLKKLPQPKLSRLADWRIRLQIYRHIWQKRFISWRISWHKVIVLQSNRLAYALIVLVLFCLVVVIPGFAYASPEVTRGHWLYPVKQAIEKVELAFPQSAPAKVATYEKMAERRLAEAAVLTKKPEIKKPQAIVETIKEAVAFSDKAVVAVQQIATSTEKDKLDNLITAKQDEHMAELSAVAAQVGPANDDTVVDTIALALDKIKQVKVRTDKKIKFQRLPGLLPKLEIEQSATSTVATSTIITEPEEAKQVDEQTILEATATKALKEIPEGKNRPKIWQFTKEKSTTTPQKIENKNKAIVQENIENMKANIKTLKSNLESKPFDQNDVTALINRLNSKIKKAGQALNSGNLNQADDLLKTTEALTNNAEHFIKPKKEQLQGQEDKSDNIKEGNNNLGSQDPKWINRNSGSDNNNRNSNDESN